MGSDLRNGAEVKDFAHDHNEIIFGDALSALSYNDWKRERAFTQEALAKTAIYWNNICPCEIPADVPANLQATNNSVSELAPPKMLSSAIATRPVSNANFAAL